MKLLRTALLIVLLGNLIHPEASRAEVLIGNLDAPDDISNPTALRIGGPEHPTVSRGVFSLSFTTPDKEYLFENLKLRLNQRPEIPTADPFVSLFADNGSGIPGALVVRLEEDRSLAPGTETYTFTASTKVTLEANTTYHVIVSNANDFVYGWVYSDPWTDPTGSATFESVRSFNSIVRIWGSPIPPRPKLEVNASPDDDGDGIPSDEDACPHSILTETVIIDGFNTDIENVLFADGCTISDLVKHCEESSRNHGKFVSCVGRLSRRLQADGVITEREQALLISAAARSDIGK